MKSLLNEGQTSLQELQELLKDIQVPLFEGSKGVPLFEGSKGVPLFEGSKGVPTQSPAVAEAVQSLFGEGHKVITFQMFLECLELTRNVGRATAAEYI